MYSSKCGDDAKNKSKGFLNLKQSILSLKKKKYLDGKEYQRECNNCNLRSNNHEKHLQEMKKSTLSVFDDKGRYDKNIKSKQWE